MLINQNLIKFIASLIYMYFLIKKKSNTIIKYIEKWENLKKSNLEKGEYITVSEN